MHRPFRLSVAVLAPLVLAGCGVPIGVQVASLLADGLSLLTTEKTLTDHGISAVAGEDCAVWRGFNGEDICRDDEAGALAVADAQPFALDEGDSVVVDGSAWPSLPPALAATPAPAAPPPAPSGDRAADVDGLAAEDLPSVPAPAWSPPAAPEPVVEPVVVVETVTAPPPADPPADPPAAASMAAIAPAATAPDPAPVRWTTEAKGGTFLIIASYRRAANAERFARGNAGLAPAVLAGKAKGRSVFRVAVGPLAKAERSRMRARLVAAGFADVWALTVKEPKGPPELASVN